jgi:hypothetical protein
MERFTAAGGPDRERRRDHVPPSRLISRPVANRASAVIEPQLT